jgi:hypothetical protein
MLVPGPHPVYRFGDRSCIFKEPPLNTQPRDFKVHQSLRGASLCSRLSLYVAFSHPGRGQVLLLGAEYIGWSFSVHVSLGCCRDAPGGGSWGQGWSCLLGVRFGRGWDGMRLWIRPLKPFTWLVAATVAGLRFVLLLRPQESPGPMWKTGLAWKMRIRQQLECHLLWDFMYTEV